eukprot:951540_1
MEVDVPKVIPEDPMNIIDASQSSMKRISTVGVARSSISSAYSDNMVTPTPAENDSSKPPTNIVSRYNSRSRTKLPVIQSVQEFKPATEIPALKINAQHIPKLDSEDNESKFGELPNSKPFHYAVRSEDDLMSTVNLEEDNIQYVSTPRSFSTQVPHILDWIEPDNVEIPEEFKDTIHHTTNSNSKNACGCCVL